MPYFKEKTIEMIIDKEIEKSYFEVPFYVPQGISKLEVSYSYKRKEITSDEFGDVYSKEINIVDMAIRDESKAFRGASGSERLYFHITENEATPGYIEGKINEGEWALILGAYRLQENGCCIKIKIKFTLKERILIKGDLHIHSLHSDGKYGIMDIINGAKLQGLDFIFLTDHNTFSQNDNLISNDILVVIPGMEWTHYFGHANFLGIKRPIKNFLSNDRKTTINIMEEARNNGALVTINHPFCKNCPWKWGFDIPYDAVEIWNGPMKESEYNAISWWKSMLIKGEIIPIVGGSDSHKAELFRIIGTPTTFIYSDSKGKSDIINAIRKGHSFISYTSNGPIIDFSIENRIIGDCIVYKEGLKGLIVIENVEEEDQIKLISDEGIEKLIVVQGQNIINVTFEVENKKFYRIEVWRELISSTASLVAITNPIYIRNQ